jgi:hypothetical protein
MHACMWLFLWKIKQICSHDRETALVQFVRRGEDEFILIIENLQDLYALQDEISDNLIKF